MPPAALTEWTPQLKHLEQEANIAPHDTNTEREARRHRPALLGIAAALVFVLLLFLGYLFYETDGETDRPVDSSTMETQTAPQ